SKKESAATMTVGDDSGTKTFSIEVPNVKDWNRSAGVAAYYSAKRLKKAVEEGVADIVVIAVPEKTSGAKFESLKEELRERMVVLSLNQDTAAELVDATNEGRLPDSQLETFRELLRKIAP
ncbi:MAG: hypothetical protein DRO93_13145, partial [Candidatus Thorarchaeota archaeon]